MRISGGRFVRIFQWIAPVVLVVFVLFGRALFGAPLGWMAAIGLFIAPFVIIAMYIPPIIGLFDREAKAARSTRVFYDVTSYVLWAAMLLMGLSLVDGGDSGDVGSVLTTWGLSDPVAEGMFVGALIFSILAWIATLVAAIASVVASSRRTR